MAVTGFDHAAVPAADLDAMLAFYRKLGCAIDDSLAPQVYSIHFGANKINLHAPVLWQSDFALRGPAAMPGCGDFCFIWSGDQAALDQRLGEAEARVIEGPVTRIGGRGTSGTSTYVRDPDGNLLEFIIYPDN